MRLPDPTPASIARARVMFQGPGTVTCSVCLHPTTQIKQTKKPGLFTWRCGTCGIRAWTDLRGASWWAGRGDRLSGLSVPALLKQARNLDSLGFSQPFDPEGPQPWKTEASRTGVQRTRCPRRYVCFACGMQTAIQQLDKHGRPYSSCPVCSARLFTYDIERQRRLMGLMDYVASERGGAEFTSDWQRGQQFLTDLFLAPVLAPTQENSIHQEVAL